jgi:Fic family protein
MGQDRESIAQVHELILDPVLKAQKEAENGARQFRRAVDLIRDHVQDPEKPFRLAPRHILELNFLALEAIHPLAGTYRNTPVHITKSSHKPPGPFAVAEEVALMCDYVHQNWAQQTAVHLGAFVLWKLNWIHPFADGNGRTSRVLSHVVISLRLDSILPGSPTVPEQIVADKKAYYDGLEQADAAWKNGQIVLTQLEAMITSMLAKQFLSALGSPQTR